MHDKMLMIRHGVDTAQVARIRNTVCGWLKAKNDLVYETWTLVVSSLGKLESEVRVQLSATFGQMARLNGGRVNGPFLFKADIKCFSHQHLCQNWSQALWSICACFFFLFCFILFKASQSNWCLVWQLFRDKSQLFKDGTNQSLEPFGFYGINYLRISVSWEALIR